MFNELKRIFSKSVSDSLKNIAIIIFLLGTILSAISVLAFIIIAFANGAIVIFGLGLLLSIVVLCSSLIGSLIIFGYAEIVESTKKLKIQNKADSISTDDEDELPEL